MPKIGLLIGRETTFPQAFIDRVNSLDNGFIAESISLAGSRIDDVPGYAVIIDRVSHEVPYYRSYVKNAALHGTVVINDPFWFPADDKFIGAAIARRLGVAIPRTVALPNHSYSEDISAASLRNLVYPLPWDEIVAYTGLPAYLKPSAGGGWQRVHRVRSVEELLYYYDQSGQLSMLLQEAIEFDQYIRCLCLGGDYILPLRYNPLHPNLYERYGGILGEEQLGMALYSRVIDDARRLNQALGYTMNTVEFAVRDGVPYAIDFLNPVCDLDAISIGREAFTWAVQTLADLAVRYATQGPPAVHSYLFRQATAQDTAMAVAAAGSSPAGTAAPPPAAEGKAARKRPSRKRSDATENVAQPPAEPAPDSAKRRATRKRTPQS